MFAYTRFRQPVGAVFFTLIVSLSLTSCRAYRHSAIRPDAMVDMVQVFVLDENFPEQVAWQVDVSALRESGLEGKPKFISLSTRWPAVWCTNSIRENP